MRRMYPIVYLHDFGETCPHEPGISWRLGKYARFHGFSYPATCSSHVFFFVVSHGDLNQQPAPFTPITGWWFQPI